MPPTTLAGNRRLDTTWDFRQGAEQIRRTVQGADAGPHSGWRARIACNAIVRLGAAPCRWLSRWTTDQRSRRVAPAGTNRSTRTDRASTSYRSPPFSTVTYFGDTPFASVSRSWCHRTPRLCAGNVKGRGVSCAFRRISKVSSTIARPFSSVSAMASPARRSMRERTEPLSQSSSVIPCPSGRNQEMSLTSDPWIRRP